MENDWLFGAMLSLLKNSAVCPSTVGSFPLKFSPEQWREAMRSAAKNSNINSTVHITYQLVGRSTFLHRGLPLLCAGQTVLRCWAGCACQNEWKLYERNHNIFKLLCRRAIFWPLSTCVALPVFSWEWSCWLVWVKPFSSQWRNRLHGSQ